MPYKPTAAERRATREFDKRFEWVDGTGAYPTGPCSRGLTNEDWWMARLGEFLSNGMNLRDAIRTLGNEMDAPV